MTSELVLLKEKINENPEAIAKALVDLAVDIEENDKRINTIKNRKLFNMILRNNTKDLAEAMLALSKTDYAIMQITQGVIIICGDNTRTLRRICDSLEKQDEVKSGDSQSLRYKENVYYQMTKEYFKKALVLSKRTQSIKRWLLFLSCINIILIIYIVLQLI